LDYLLKAEFWQQQRIAFTSAFWMMLPLLVAVVWAVWWFRGTRFAGKIDGLEAKIGVLNERLNLAADKVAIADRAKDELEKQVQTLRVELAALTAKAENASLAKVEAQLQKVEIATGNLATANNAVSSTLSMSLKTTDTPDFASFTVDTTKIQ
jgi:hypothetical protein